MKRSVLLFLGLWLGCSDDPTEATSAPPKTCTSSAAGAAGAGNFLGGGFLGGAAGATSATTGCDDGARVCIPGQQLACACIGSPLQGAQVCSADGASFGPCIGCPGDPAAGGASGGSQAGGNGQGNKPGSGGISSAGGNSAGGNSAGGMPGAGGGGAAPGCGTDPTKDSDGDGWTPAQGDCDDCNAAVNPGAFDTPGDSTDDDCDGTAAQPGPQASCDAGLTDAVADPYDAARAMGLCKAQVPESPADPKQKTWGILKAGFNRISGPFLQAPLPVGINVGTLPDFGVASKPREGARLFALSTGEARAQGHAGFTSNTCGQSGQQTDSYPPGFPKNGSCGETGTPYDGVALDLMIRVPTNARSFSFDYRFFTCEYPAYVCQQYNDVFAVLMGPSPLKPGDPMADASNQSANVAFQSGMDGSKEVIGVNNQDFLRACLPSTDAPGYINCKGESDLTGTGFTNHAGSAWLRTSVAVEPGSILNLRFAIWDSADGALDSTTLVDNFAWHPDTVPAGAVSEVIIDGI